MFGVLAAGAGEAALIRVAETSSEADGIVETCQEEAACYGFASAYNNYFQMPDGVLVEVAAVSPPAQENESGSFDTGTARTSIQWTGWIHFLGVIPGPFLVRTGLVQVLYEDGALADSSGDFADCGLSLLAPECEIVVNSGTRLPFRLEASAFVTSLLPPAGLAEGYASANLRFAFFDLEGRSLDGVEIQVSDAPEPTTFWLTGLALGIVAGWRMRRRRKVRRRPQIAGGVKGSPTP